MLEPEQDHSRPVTGTALCRWFGQSRRRPGAL